MRMLIVARIKMKTVIPKLQLLLIVKTTFAMAMGFKWQIAK